MTESIFRSFSRIVDLAVSEKVDFVVIAGDAFDESTITPATRHRFASELARMGVPCFMARGNHDQQVTWASSIPYPPNVHEFGTEPEYIDPDGMDGVEVAGVSFADWHEERNLPSLIQGSLDRFTVAVLHCDVDSAEARYNYSPCRLSDMSGRGVDYWAIGHVHKRAVLSEGPYVVYPGNIQGRKITESGEKGCYLVTVDEGRVSELRFVPTQEIVWKELSVDITSRDLTAAIRELRSRIGPGDIARVTFMGSGLLDAMVRLHPDDVAFALSRELSCTVCGIEAKTTPEINMDARAAGSDMTAKVISVGRGMESADREELLKIILSNSTAAKHMDFYTSLSDEMLRELVRRATGMLVATMEGSR